MQETLQIHTLDLRFMGREELLGSHLLRRAGDVVLIESGPGSSKEALVEGLKSHGLEPKDVKHLLLTHIHLDHAGGAGWLAQHGAKVYVHHVGVKHLVDPSRLWQSATRIYGEDLMEFLWGEMLPIPEEQIVPLYDNDELELLGTKILAMDTPGHATHHMCYLVDGCCFTGDVLGTRIPGESHVRVPSPPPEFVLELWQESIRKIREKAPKVVYPAHFGAYHDVDEHLSHLEDTLLALVRFVEQEQAAGKGREQIIDEYHSWIAGRSLRDGVKEENQQRYELTAGATGNIDGVLRYLRKRAE